MYGKVNRNRSMETRHQATIADLLLSWFDVHARDLPWRTLIPQHICANLLNRLKGSMGSEICKKRLTLRRDPYTVVVSELMLQQTQVSAVIPYYERFIERFPTVEVLAMADETEVLKMWEGLGYYRRARSLSALAKQVIEKHGGIIPPNKKLLLSLPGIGSYTAGAILSFAYDLPEPAVDGNVVRIFSRLDSHPHVRGDARAIRSVSKRVQELLPDDRAGDFNEALMDLGATICRPSSPECAICPLQNLCGAYALDAVESFPVRKDIEKKPVDKFSYVLIHCCDLVYVQCRPKGLLEGLYEFYPLAQPFRSDEETIFCTSLNQELKVDQHANSLLEEMRVGECTREYGDANLQELGCSGLSGLDNANPSRLGGNVDGVMSVSFVGDKKAVYSHRIWEVSCWEVEIAAHEGRPPYVGTELEGEWVTVEELSQLPFPAVLVPWRDAFLARHRHDCEATSTRLL